MRKTVRANTAENSRLSHGAAIPLGILGVCFAVLSTDLRAESRSCFDEINLEASFFALTTTKQSELADWYQRIFGLETAKEFSFPDGTVTGTLMRKEEFVVEIFNRDDVLETLDYVADAAPEQWRGVMKVGFYTDANLPMLKKCLLAQGVKAGRIFGDDKLGIDLLQVIDPEQNVLEIVSRSVVQPW